MAAGLEAAVHRTRRQAGLVDLAVAGCGRGMMVALLDGPIATTHPSLGGAAIRTLLPDGVDASGVAGPRARAHATFLASVLVGRDPRVLGLCADAQLISVPVADRAMLEGLISPDSVFRRLAAAVALVVDEGADVIVCGLEFPRSAGPIFPAAVRSAAQVGVWSVFPAGNSGGQQASELFATAGAVPVAFSTRLGAPHPMSAWGIGVARHGLWHHARTCLVRCPLTAIVFAPGAVSPLPWSPAGSCCSARLPGMPR